jgi:hypothetical protein
MFWMRKPTVIKTSSAICTSNEVSGVSIQASAFGKRVRLVSDASIRNIDIST